MDTSIMQQELFKAIKAGLPPSIPVADEIAKLLNISVDSVYRRMRGEKPITLDELHLLCSHYRISLDSVLNIQTGGFMFHGSLVDHQSFRFADYLSSVIKWLMYFNSFRDKTLYYMCKDIPIFHHFHFREIAAFKYYFWMKNLFAFPEFANQKFSFEAYPDEIFNLGKKNLELYNQLSIVEFWNIENINSTIRQLEFCQDAQLFTSKEDVIRIYDALEKLVGHLQAQAAVGYKYNYDDPEKKRIADYQIYYNEVILGDNNMHMVLDGTKVTLISHMVINYMITRDISFNEKTYDYIQNMMKKSTRISSVSEKERARFFRRLRERIAARKERLG